MGNVCYLKYKFLTISLYSFIGRKRALLLITIRLLLRVHLKDSSVFFALKNIKGFESFFAVTIVARSRIIRSEKFERL